MTQNNNFSVLPFYRSIEEQNHRKSYAYGEIYPLYCPVSRLIPFQFFRNHTEGASIELVELYDKNGKLIAVITEQMKTAGLQLVHVEEYGYDVIVYTAQLPITIQYPEGMYYLAIRVAGTTYYSDIFTAVQDVSSYLRIEWYDVENFVLDSGIIVYNNPKFRNVLYLCTELGKPEYQFEEEGESRDGYFFPTKRLSEKTYRFTFLASEYLCDAMRLIRMADIIKIRDQYGRQYRCDTFLITPRWQTQGDLASVEAEFETDTIAKKICFGYTIPDKGDFNSDFNNDFNNE